MPFNVSFKSSTRIRTKKLTIYNGQMITFQICNGQKTFNSRTIPYSIPRKDLKVFNFLLLFQFTSSKLKMNSNHSKFRYFSIDFSFLLKVCNFSRNWLFWGSQSSHRQIFLFREIFFSSNERKSKTVQQN